MSCVILFPTVSPTPPTPPGTCALADLVVSIETPDPVVIIVGTLSYAITTTNNGPDTATGVILRVTIDPGVLVDNTAIPPDCIYTPCFTNGISTFGGTLVCPIGTLLPGQSVFHIIIGSALRLGFGQATTSLCSTAVVMGNEMDPNIANNFTTATIIQTP